MAKNISKIPKSYSKPPIMEAVVELRFAEKLSDKKLNALLEKRKNQFSIQKIEGFEFKIKQEETGASAETDQKFIGYKLTQKTDSSYIIQLKHDSVSLSRLPPYEGWPTLYEEFKRQYNWYTAKKFKRITRIGVRYINRIDIPIADSRIDLDEYFKISIKVPEKTLPILGPFFVQTAAKIDDKKTVQITIHSTEAPILNHTSFIFDLDVFLNNDLPTNEAALDESLEDIRIHKDQLFEQLLTPKCKRIFK